MVLAGVVVAGVGVDGVSTAADCGTDWADEFDVSGARRRWKARSHGSRRVSRQSEGATSETACYLRPSNGSVSSSPGLNLTSHG